MISNHSKSCAVSVLKKAGNYGSRCSIRYYTTDNKPGNEWDFLSSSNEGNSTDTSKDDLVFNADAGDAYAQQKPLISESSQGFSTSQKPIHANSSQQKVRLSKENMNELFRSSRQPKTTDSAFSGVQATHQERLAFAKIFDTILQRARTSSPGASNTQFLKKSEGLLPSMQAIFEKKYDATEGSDLAESDKGEGGVRVTNDDIRKYPMSMGPFMDMPKSSSVDLTRVFQVLSIIKRKLEPVLKHMNEDLQTDAELSDFFKSKVLARFQQKKGGNKTAQGNSKVSLVNHDLDSLEALDVTLENFPVDYNTLPFLLKETMRILADDFNSPVDALALFELTKRESIDAYVAGCNVSVYNEVIRIKWNAFQDLHFVESMINEMQINGILGNSETAEILGDISKAVTYIKAPKVLQMPQVTGSSGDNSTAESGTPLWSQADEERIENINKFRLNTMQTLIRHDTIKHDSLLSGLISR